MEEVGWPGVRFFVALSRIGFIRRAGHVVSVNRRPADAFYRLARVAWCKYYGTFNARVRCDALRLFLGYLPVGLGLRPVISIPRPLAGSRTKGTLRPGKVRPSWRSEKIGSSPKTIPAGGRRAGTMEARGSRLGYAEGPRRRGWVSAFFCLRSVTPMRTTANILRSS